MRRVVVESPFKGATPEAEARNLRYLRACLHDCFERGEAPFASHAIYTQPGVLDDKVPAERDLGIRAGLLWGEVADVTVVYTDLGISNGMRLGTNQATLRGRRIEYRRLENWEDKNG